MRRARRQDRRSITGGNSGIGLETAVALARDGAHVVITARTRRAGATALAEIEARSGSATEVMAARSRVVRVGARVRRRRSRDATTGSTSSSTTPASSSSDRRTTVDGHETQFQTNHLGHFLLTNLLRDQLVAQRAGTRRDRRVRRAPLRAQGRRLRRPRVDAPVPRVPDLRAHQADEPALHARAGPPARRHGCHRERGASRLRRDSLLPRRRHRVHGQRRDGARPAVREVPRGRRADVDLRGVVTAARRRDRPVLRQVPARQARGYGDRRRRGHASVGASANSSPARRTDPAPTSRSSGTTSSRPSARWSSTWSAPTTHRHR